MFSGTFLKVTGRHKGLSNVNARLLVAELLANLSMESYILKALFEKKNWTNWSVS